MSRRSSRQIKSTTGLELQQLLTGECPKDSETFRCKLLPGNPSLKIVHAPANAGARIKEAGAVPPSAGDVFFPAPEDITYEWLQSNGLDKPMIFAPGTASALGMRAPKAVDLTVPSIVSTLGPERVVEVLAVSTQKGKKMTLRSWANYWNQGERARSEILNLISLEVRVLFTADNNVHRSLVRPLTPCAIRARALLLSAGIGRLTKHRWEIPLVLLILCAALIGLTLSGLCLCAALVPQDPPVIFACAMQAARILCAARAKEVQPRDHPNQPRLWAPSGGDHPVRRKHHWLRERANVIKERGKKLAHSLACRSIALCLWQALTRTFTLILVVLLFGITLCVDAKFSLSRLRRLVFLPSFSNGQAHTFKEQSFSPIRSVRKV